MYNKSTSVAFTTLQAFPRVQLPYASFARRTDRAPCSPKLPVQSHRCTIIATSSASPSTSSPFQSSNPEEWAIPNSPVSSAQLDKNSSETESGFDWLNQWYPIYGQEDVEPYKSYAVTVWSKPLVLFMDALSDSADRFVVLDDVCSHRAAPLSEGRVVTYSRGDEAPQTAIECAYHGWKFNCVGKCVDVPTIPIDGPISPRANLRPSYPVHVAAGLIFVWVGDGDPAKLGRPTPYIPDELLKPNLRNRAFRRSFNFDMATMLENLTDPAHLPWAHHSYQGNRYKVPRDGSVTLITSDMNYGYFLGRIDDKKLARREITYKAPGSVDAIIETQNSKLRVCFWATPAEPDLTLFFNVTAFPSLPLPASFLLKSQPAWRRCMQGHGIVDSDAILLYKQYALLRRVNSNPAGSAWMKEYKLPHVEWDSLALATRKFILKNIKSMPESWIQAWNRLPPPSLKPEDVMERYYSHTVDCLVCSRALRQTRWIKFFATFLAACTSVICICGGLVGVVVASAVTGLAAGAGAHANSIIKVIAAVALGILLLSLLTIKSMADHEKRFIYTTEAYDRSRRK